MYTQYRRALQTHPHGSPVKQCARVLTLQETQQHKQDCVTLQRLLTTCGVKSKVSNTISKVPHDLLLTHPFYSTILFHSFFCSPCSNHTDLIFSKLGLFTLFHLPRMLLLSLTTSTPDRANAHLFFKSQVKQHFLRGVFPVPPRSDQIQLSQVLYFCTTANHSIIVSSHLPTPPTLAHQCISSWKTGSVCLSSIPAALTGTTVWHEIDIMRQLLNK